MRSIKETKVYYTNIYNISGSRVYGGHYTTLEEALEARDTSDFLDYICTACVTEEAIESAPSSPNVFQSFEL